MMMRKVFLALAAAVLAQAASAGYLYWQVNQAAAKSPVGFSYAILNAVDADGGRTALDGVLAQDGNPIASDAINTLLDLAYEDGYTFEFQLFDNNDVLVAASEYTYEWADLKPYLYEEMVTAGAKPLEVVDFAGPVPEPSGGLLVALGLAAIALRRRRVAAAETGVSKV